uniref:RNA granule protein invertebrate n=1 Tax=Ciona intestinalis TaxID=7719 RepID=E4NKG6_CIOIN|nr:uncharacterized protein LOC100179738 [Ciona intestinalis]FAA00699.1 TPA: RNA granule protein invertebrate [Ciona intestinalis]|eukprot:NP_001265885.1 uncharacterized LOC100179738 [Ciona intestinalis]
MVVQKANTMDTKSYTGNYESIAQDPLKHVVTVIEKKIRNLDKRKVKLDGYRKIAAEGGELDRDQSCAVSKYNEVMGSLEFAKEICKAFSGVTNEVSKAQRKMQRREQTLKEDKDLKLSKYITKALMVFNLVYGEEHVREDFIHGQNGAVVLTQEAIDQMIQFHKTCLMIPNEAGQNIFDGSDSAGDHLYALHLASNKPVCGTTYSELHHLLEEMCACKYFECLPKSTKTDFVAGEDEDKASEEETADSSTKNSSLAESEDLDDQPDEAETKLPTTEFIQSAPDAAVLEQPEEVPESEPKESNVKPTRTVEEVLAEVQGEYNFLQDSMLEGERPTPLPTSHLHMHNMKPPMFHDPVNPSYPTNPPNPYPITTMDQHEAENMGMGQTTFGANQKYQNIETPVTTFNTNQHSNESFQAKQTNSSMQKDMGAFPTTGFSTLHGSTSPTQPFDINLPHQLLTPAIPEASVVLQTTPDPPATHIPLPNDKLSGYNSYNPSPPLEPANPVVPTPEPSQASYTNIPQMPPSVGAGDAERLHDKDPKIYLEEGKFEEENPPEVNNVDAKQEKILPTNQMRGGPRQQGYQNNANYRGNNRQNSNMVMYQQQQQQQRGGGYRGSNNRPYGNFDSMGHPKNYAPYQQHHNMQPFNTQYNRPPENGMFGNNVQRRGNNGPSRGNRGYPPRGSATRGASVPTYTRSRTFKPTNETSG